MHACPELNLPLTKTNILSNNKATIDITYNSKISPRSKNINIAYQLFGENLGCGWIFLIQLSYLRIWLVFIPKHFHKLRYGNLGLSLWIKNTTECCKLKNIVLHSNIMADHHFTFHNFFTYYGIHIFESVGL
jgi:hypothetical protein